MSSDPVQRLVAAVRADLRAAQLRRDRLVVSCLREILSVIDNAGAVEVSHDSAPSVGAGTAEVARRELTLDQVRALLREQVDERREAARTYRRLDDEDRADGLEQSADVIATYLDGSDAQ